MNDYRAASMRSAETVSIYIRQVYIWMTLGLAVTGIVAKFVADTPELSSIILGNSIVFFVLIIIEFGLVIALSAAIQKMSPTMATGAFLLYSVISGATLSSIFIIYPIGSISNAFFITAGTFLAMSLYGASTKRDLTSMGSFLFMGLIGIVIAMIVNIFLKSAMVDFVISCVGVLVFTGLTAYDTQKLRRLGAEIDVKDDSTMRRMVIIGALTLYLDFINLFLMMLRLLGGRKD